MRNLPRTLLTVVAASALLGVGPVGAQTPVVPQGSAPTPVACASDADCEPWQSCSAESDDERGMCVALPGTCTSDAECTVSGECREHRCAVDCLGDAQCPEGLICDALHCRPQLDPTQRVVIMPPAPCRLGEVQINIAFDMAEPAFPDYAALQLRALAECLADDPRNLVLEGHSHALGTAEYNIPLGERYARAIRRLLVETYGIDEARIVRTISYGESRPVATEDNERAWAVNRRVVIRLE